MNDLQADYSSPKSALTKNGFAVIEAIYTEQEVEVIIAAVNAAEPSNPRFRKSVDVFAIRRFLEEVPQAKPLIFNSKLRSLVKQAFSPQHFIVKSIYFDKPEQSNWFVPYHQDLMIAVDKRSEIAGYGPWTAKQEQVSVQPPVEILESIYTLRIHLDATDKNNGALKVIPGSHAKKIYRPETIDWTQEQEAVCDVPRGSVMLMRPLLLHSSGRTTNAHKRRVIHIEFSDQELAGNLSWAEKTVF